MCGISALFTIDPQTSWRQPFEASIDRIAHRGPDGRGAVYGQGDTVAAEGELPFDWALGHVRLAILDLSPAGAQPMHFDHARLWITFNGEIYNYVELRDELSRLGFAFQSHTDTEVILAAYRAWGEECLQRFRGMFAWVLVDLPKRRAWAVRDRLGIKPIYLWSSGSAAALVSEPKQLLAYPAFRPRADRQQIADFLIDGVVGHEADRSCFEGVRPLPPGHALSWQLGKLPDLGAAREYWRPALISRKLSWDESREQTGQLFEESVRLHMRSDVPVGSCLSGGIDSSSIVGVATATSGLPMHTFSSCSTDPKFDEQPYMDAVNQHCAALPVKLFADPDECLADLDRLVYHQDEPFTSLSMYAQWRVMQAAAARGVPVLLDGQGGDEALCGYRKFAWLHLKQLLARRRVLAASGHAAQLAWGGDRGLLNLRAGQRYLPAWLRPKKSSLAGLFRETYRPFARHVWQERMRDVHTLHELQWADLRHWSLPALLRYEDRNSMAHGIEARVPFVDHRFIEHCLTLPEGHFFRRGRTKRVLVDAISQYLPAAVRRRRTKMGFVTPQQTWMRGRLGAALAERVRKIRALDEVLDANAIARAFAGLAAGQPGFTDTILFRVASLALWAERFAITTAN